MPDEVWLTFYRVDRVFDAWGLERFRVGGCLDSGFLDRLRTRPTLRILG